MFRPAKSVNSRNPLIRRVLSPRGRAASVLKYVKFQMKPTVNLPACGATPGKIIIVICYARSVHAHGEIIDYRCRLTVITRNQ